MQYVFWLLLFDICFIVLPINIFPDSQSARLKFPWHIRWLLDTRYLVSFIKQMDISFGTWVEWRAFHAVIWIFQSYENQMSNCRNSYAWVFVIFHSWHCITHLSLSANMTFCHKEPDNNSYKTVHFGILWKFYLFKINFLTDISRPVWQPSWIFFNTFIEN